MRLFSETYCPTKLMNSFSAALPEQLWREIMNDHQSGRAFLRIESNETHWICPVGQPIQDSDIEDAVFLPLWMIESAGFAGFGETCTVTHLTEEAFPQATKLVLKVIDSAFYNSEVKEELEAALSSIGVVKRQSLLEIPIQNLGGFQVEVFVANTEPADIVLCDGEEVVVEFEEPVDQIAPPRPPTPIPQPPPALQEPDLMIPMETARQRGFVPFQGEGRLLGGSNANAPCWRRDCPPKRQPSP